MGFCHPEPKAKSLSWASKESGPRRRVFSPAQPRSFTTQRSVQSPPWA